MESYSSRARWPVDAHRRSPSRNMKTTDWTAALVAGIAACVISAFLSKLHRRSLFARPLAFQEWRELAPEYGDQVARYLQTIGSHFDIARSGYARLSPNDSLDELCELLGDDGMTFVEIESWLRSECGCPDLELAGEDTLWSVFAASFIPSEELATS